MCIRDRLDLYACIRPCKTYPGVRSPYQNINLVIIRENTEDLYAGIEFEKGKPETLELIEAIEKWGKGKILSLIHILPLSTTNVFLL